MDLNRSLVTRMIHVVCKHTYSSGGGGTNALALNILIHVHVGKRLSLLQQNCLSILSSEDCTFEYPSGQDISSH